MWKLWDRYSSQRGERWRPFHVINMALNVVAMVMFISADSATALIAARAVQGFATGLATATLGAAIMDTDRSRGPVLNSITAFIGLTVGSLGGGALVTYAPDPQHLEHDSLGIAHGLQRQRENHVVERIIRIIGEVSVSVALDNREAFGDRRVHALA